MLGNVKLLNLVYPFKLFLFSDCIINEIETKSTSKSDLQFYLDVYMIYLFFDNPRIRFDEARSCVQRIVACYSRLKINKEIISVCQSSMT